MTTGFPLSPMTASTFILVGLTGVTLAEHQRFLFKWALGSTLVNAEEARAIVDTFLGTATTEARYLRRLAKLHRLEQTQ
jgi:hypothetical protein